MKRTATVTSQHTNPKYPLLRFFANSFCQTRLNNDFTSDVNRVCSKMDNQQVFTTTMLSQLSLDSPPLISDMLSQSRVSSPAPMSEGLGESRPSSSISLSQLLSQPHVTSPVPMGINQFTPAAAFVNIMEKTKTYKVRINDNTVNGDSVVNKQDHCTFGNEPEPAKQSARIGLKNKMLRFAGALVKRKGSSEEQNLRHSPKIVEDPPFVTISALQALEQEQGNTLAVDVSKEILHSIDNATLLDGVTRAVTAAVEDTRTSPTRDRVVVRKLSNENTDNRNQLPACPIEFAAKLEEVSPKRSFSFAHITKSIPKKKKINNEMDYRDQMRGLVDQDVPIPDASGEIPRERVQNINNWVSELAVHQPDGEGQDDLLSLSTAELVRINGANIDRVALVKKYRGPTNTPSRERVE